MRHARYVLLVSVVVLAAACGGPVTPRQATAAGAAAAGHRGRRGRGPGEEVGPVGPMGGHV
ncbi:hypothetical protein, partial [Mycolicibacterium hodleri]|uniref:hypothetical protein n=1 Tax=Mycolicibacterium hodleri TaxID=49897 RepID=UPI0021F27D73